MKYTAALAALVAVASAQTLADIPSCALPCLQKAVAKDTTCSQTDVVCICKSFSKIQGDATSCVISACGESVAINKVLPATQALCKNPTNPESSSAPAASSTAAAQSSYGGASSSAVVSTVSSAVAVTTVSSYVAPSSSVSGYPTGPNGTHTGGSAPGTSSTAVVPPPGNAAAAVGSIGGLAMLALGALAL